MSLVETQASIEFSAMIAKGGNVYKQAVKELKERELREDGRRAVARQQELKEVSAAAVNSGDNKKLKQMACILFCVEHNLAIST